ncbi:hypothetical protein BU15DRAFT_64799 [Melanogaster broomeanus]|nr:hypothetical protein BU15DRAFT_64799 [Melanogaster broomeanus]
MSFESVAKADRMNSILDSEGVKPEYIDGIRVKDAKTLHVARRVFPEENLKLVGAIENPARGPVSSPRVRSPESTSVLSQLPFARVPCRLAERNDGQILNANVDVAAGELAKEVEPMEIVFLNQKGGLFHGVTGEKFGVINLDEEYDQSMKEPWVKYGTKLKLREFKELLDVLPRSSSVATLECTGKDQLRQIICERDEEGKWSIYADEPFDAVAIVSHPKGETPVLTKLLASRSGVLNTVPDNVFNALKKDHRRLIWTASISPPTPPSPSSASHPGGEEVIVRSRHFGHAGGSFTRSGCSLFWYVINDVSEMEKIMKGLEESGRVEEGVPAFGTSESANGWCQIHSRSRTGVPSRTRGYATHAPASTPTLSTQPKRVALIGPRAYTGQALTSLLNTHPYLSLTHVSSRVLQGHPPEGYTKSLVTHTTLSVEDVERMETEGEVDAWVMALPDGVCKPFVDAIEKDHRGRKEDAVWWRI